MKILHCPTTIGGNAWGLSQAERKLELDSTVMIYQNNWLNYQADIDLHLEKYPRLLAEIKKWFSLISSLKRYDIFHFNFGSSFLSYPRLNLFNLDLLDLSVLRKAGKKIIVTYQGCDARQKDFCVKNFTFSACAEPDCYNGICNDKTDLIKKRRITKFDYYADKIFALNPDLIYVLPKAEFQAYANVNMSEWTPAKGIKKDNRIRVLHAPTDRGAKGSKYIMDALRKLKQEYKEVELILVERIPHHQVRQLYEMADLVVDQLLVGWYGGVAVEVMALAKPVVCYIREQDLKFIPTQMKEALPIINANIHNIYDVLKKCVEERDKLVEIGKKSRVYVEEWHDPLKIAKRTKEVYESIL
ncbi:MAG: glycosyltransferase [bacterium]